MVKLNEESTQDKEGLKFRTQVLNTMVEVDSLDLETGFEEKQF